VRRWITGLLVVGSLYGCSGGGLVPNGPHSIGPEALRRLVRIASVQYHVPANLIKAVITIESHGDPSAVSVAGAAGLMQLMPATASTYGVVNRFDPEENVQGGSAYLRQLLDRYHNNIALALAAYNAGPNAVDAAHGIPPFPETRAYVARVTAALHDPAF